jgi:hypothetical protein
MNCHYSAQGEYKCTKPTQAASTAAPAASTAAPVKSTPSAVLSNAAPVTSTAAPVVVTAAAAKSTAAPAAKFTNVYFSEDNLPYEVPELESFGDDDTNDLGEDQDSGN